MALQLLTGRSSKRIKCAWCYQLVPGIEARTHTRGGQVIEEWRLAEHRTPGCRDRCLGVDLTSPSGESGASGCYVYNSGCPRCAVWFAAHPRQLDLDEIDELTDPGRYIPGWTGEHAG